MQIYMIVHICIYVYIHVYVLLFICYIYVVVDNLHVFICVLFFSLPSNKKEKLSIVLAVFNRLENIYF